MEQPRLDVGQLQKRNPTAWTELLRREPELADVIVTAVSAQPIHSALTDQLDTRVARYFLTLDGCSDPISLIGKQTNRTELLFYRDIAPQIPGLAPRCWYTHLVGGKGWIILDDVCDDYPPSTWAADDAEAIVNDLTAFHARFWRQEARLQSSGFAHFIGQKRYTLDELRREHEVYFEEGPAAVLSQHAMDSAGALAPKLLKAANGLTVMRSLDGWPGIMGETHMTAVAELLDDPVPMLQPLRELPMTLLHGNPFSYHWRLTFLDRRRLIDWQKAKIGPSVCDLVSFVDQFDMLYGGDGRWPIQLRPEWPITEETMIDSYLLSLST
ncbi:MAG: phosphotransferase, partial [Chloroflexi bacterium]|nr:phosphotransferase [Chloroflexota bacterium]